MSAADELPFPKSRRRIGRVERAANDALRAADLEDSDALLKALIRSGARQIDAVDATDQPYAWANVARQLESLVHAARLAPVDRATAAGDPFADFLAQLQDPDHDAAVRDAQD